MDLEIIILSEVSQRQISWFWYVDPKKKNISELIYKIEIDL